MRLPLLSDPVVLNFESNEIEIATVLRDSVIRTSLSSMVRTIRSDHVKNTVSSDENLTERTTEIGSSERTDAERRSSSSERRARSVMEQNSLRREARTSTSRLPSSDDLHFKAGSPELLRQLRK
jgi:hypothetical protein